MLCGKVKKTNKQMTNLISKFSKFIEWLFPIRSAIRQEIDWITERCDKLEKRFDELEKRYSEECCFRMDCPNRINRVKPQKKQST